MMARTKAGPMSKDEQFIREAGRSLHQSYVDFTADLQQVEAVQNLNGGPLSHTPQVRRAIDSIDRSLDRLGERIDRLEERIESTFHYA